MSYFQNLTDAAFRGSFPLGDRQYAIDYLIGPNVNQSDNMVTWNSGPYDLTTDGGVLTIGYAPWENDYKFYSYLAIDVTGSDPSATTAQEVITILNANTTFNSMFVTSVFTPVSGQPIFRVRITKKIGRAKNSLRMYILNAGAETGLNFNKKAPIAELPTYFDRHTIENRFAFPDSVGMLVLLDPSDPIDAAIITAAGFDPLVVQADWQLLRGRSGIFNFQKNTIDGSNRITESIFYPAGALVGDLARKTTYTYTGANTNPTNTTQVPYVLQSGDLITP